MSIDAAASGCGTCVALGKMDEAEELMPIMRQKGFRPDGRFYNVLIKVRVPNTVDSCSWIWTIGLLQTERHEKSDKML